MKHCREGKNLFSREKRFFPSLHPPLFEKSEVFCRSDVAASLILTHHILTRVSELFTFVE